MRGFAARVAALPAVGPPQGVLDLLAGLFEVAFRLIGAALALELRIVGRVADALLHTALELLRLVLGLVFRGHVSLLPESAIRVVPRLARLNQPARHGVCVFDVSGADKAREFCNCVAYGF